MDIAVLASAQADVRARAALLRACERIPATPVFVADDERVARLRALAVHADTRWIIVVDADAVLLPDAFGRLRRALASSPALLGGRGLLAGRQYFGAMFAPPRFGPQPFEFSPVSGLAEERELLDLMRGPIDVPQRGVVVVSASLVRSLDAEAQLDPVVLALDLAVTARVVGASVICEPAMSFAIGEDDIAVRRRMLGLRRFADAGVWERGSLHREPPALRSRLIDRDTRVMGNFRGYAKRAFPPIETITYGARDADLLRAAFARTSDRYVLCVPAGASVSRASVEALAERVEGSARYAIALEHDEPPYGAVLVHAGRLYAGGTLRGDTAGAVIADAIGSLPAQRLYAVGPSGPLVPAELPTLPEIRSLDVIYVAASQPVVANHTIAALLQERIEGTLAAVFPADATTLQRSLASYGNIRLAPDASDPILAAGLNAAIAACRADAVAIVRDDVNVTRGVLARLCDAFARVARLGVAVPRTGGGERLEGLPDISYGNLNEMQTFAERRAAQFAREAMLVDAASVPAIVVARNVFDIVGGFDEAFGFSRFGIEDFTRRVRAVNLHVVRCDDAYVHVFPAEEARSLLTALDTSASHFERYRERWSTARGFDPARDIVPLRVPAVVAAPPLEVPDARVRVLVPVANVAEWQRLEPEIASFTAAFRADDPVDLAIALDGSFTVAMAVAALRELLLQTGIPMEETLNVRVDPVGDLALWRDAAEANLRLASCDRAELAAVAIVADAASLRARFSESATV